MHRSFIKNVKERKERSVHFKKNAKERENVAFFWKEHIRTQERWILLKRMFAQPLKIRDKNQWLLLFSLQMYA